MLTELYIRNFAIIDDLRLQFHAGFNVLTGETGAGKSIILDAVMLVLGGRADTSVIRTGGDEAYVEATFVLEETVQTAVRPLLDAEGLDDEANEHLLVARELRVNGRHICRVNGRAVSLSVLRQVTEPLIDIHGQGQHLSLLKPRSHLPLLDSYAILDADRHYLAKEVNQLGKVRQELHTLQTNKQAVAQRIDMLKFQIEEISAAQLQPNEEEQLREERTRLANAEHLMTHSSEAIAFMVGMDDDADSIVDMMGQVERALSQLVRYDASQQPLLERLQGLSFQINEVAADLQDYRDELEFDSGRLSYIEERLELINTLKRKYGAEIAIVLTRLEEAQDELKKISHNEARVEELKATETDYLKRIGQMAKLLSNKRKTAAKRLSTVVEKQLSDLSMAGTRFQVNFRCESVENGAFVGSERFAFDQTGIDQVEFLLSTNPGEPLKPMAKVASGGETARLMLALKTALAQVDKTPTLIFDEIDQGIGGRIGDIVGRKLWRLTAIARHQVIIVTHLPQLAGYGDVHFHVNKHVVEQRTKTNVIRLDTNGRIHELAAMLGTYGEHAKGGAVSILKQAQLVKQKRP